VHKILSSAQADIEDFGCDAGRRCRTEKWRALERNARHRARELRHPAPPTGIFDGIVANL
jgi:hypothetical protein